MKIDLEQAARDHGMRRANWIASWAQFARKHGADALAARRKRLKDFAAQLMREEGGDFFPHGKP